MFGLYFWRDPSEISSDPQKYPKGVIHLMDRTTFYDEENIVDLSNYIDRSEEIKIVPQMPTKKWLRFELEQAESEAAEEYSKTYGEVYGSKRVDTNFNFNTETEDLIDTIPYRAGIDVLEVDKYFNRWVGDETPSYVFNGFKYELFKVNGTELDSTEVEVPVEKHTYLPINSNNWENTDSFAKLQLHSAENEPIDGENILVFLTGDSYYNEQNTKYWLTDDTQEMVTLNEGEPCYILTHTEDTVPTYSVNGQVGAQKIAYAFTSLPKFQRNIVGYGGIITHSLSMGEPRTTYVRDTFVNKDMSIYGKCWKKFITDLYDVNNRKLTCSVRFPERPNGMMLRRFYWFDSAIWRLNTVTDWNISSYAPTKCEFVKVMDVNNYKNDIILDTAAFSIEIVNVPLVKEEETSIAVNRYYTITADAQDLILRIKTQGSSWCLNSEEAPEIRYDYEDGTSGSFNMNEMMSPNTYCSNGDAERVLSIPKNTKNVSRTFTLYVQDSADRYHRCYVTQLGNGTEVGTDPILFTVSPMYINASSVSRTQTVNITSSTADGYTVSTPSWISVVEKTDTYFTLNINGNATKLTRFGTVSVTAYAAGKDDKEVGIGVKQTGLEPVPIEPKPL